MRLIKNHCKKREFHQKTLNNTSCLKKMWIVSADFCPKWPGSTWEATALFSLYKIARIVNTTFNGKTLTTNSTNERSLVLVLVDIKNSENQFNLLKNRFGVYKVIIYSQPESNHLCLKIINYLNPLFGLLWQKLPAMHFHLITAPHMILSESRGPMHGNLNEYSSAKFPKLQELKPYLKIS